MKILVKNKDSFSIVEIDEDDWERFICHGWFVNNRYVKAKRYSSVITLHRFILNDYNTLHDIDHIDGNKLNNKKENLRVCTRSQNMANVGSYTTNKSGYKGVSKVGRKWRASIMYHKKSIHLGYYEEIVDAVVHYNKAAIELFGEFARINKIKEN